MAAFQDLPMVSICTPTFNRRPFMPALIQCVANQTYPADRIEWVITDDGTDPVEDLVKDIPNVKYVRYTKKMCLGKKRNITHEHCIGSIIVYMDDDDYYPPTRISHAVETLLANPSCMIAGCLQLPIYYNTKSAIYMTGPYGTNRITAATFAFTRDLLATTQYNETACISEEADFLRNYTIPIVPLDPLQTILVFAHPCNTIDKESLLEQTEDISTNPYIRLTPLTALDFITDEVLYDFYVTRMPDMLLQYEPGQLIYKPDVLLKISDIKIKRLQDRLTKANIENDRLQKLNTKLRELVLQKIKSTQTA
jgi:glycosyltransferase involved in cell wall biosynthesis